MRRLIPRLSTATGLLVLVAMALPAQGEEVWALRTRFTITMSEADIDYAEDDAQWRVKFRDGYVVANNVGFAVEFSDGRVLYNTDLAHDRTVREVLETPFGEGTRCHVYFKAKDGVVVEHFLTLYRTRPFVELGMAVTNTGNTPLTITRFVPVLARPEHFPGLGPSTEATRYPLGIRGGEPVFDPEGPPSWTCLHDPVTGRTLAVGLLPSGGMRGGSELAPSGDGWAGKVFFDHSPGTVLAPGERVETGSVWLAAGVTNPEQMALYYGWAFTVGETKAKRMDLPRAWVTVPDNQGFGNLLKTARAYRSGIRYALVPASWEGRPGSMRGGAPGYPGDMAAAARALSALNIAPGITLDPLAGNGGKQAWVVRAADGQAWLNPKHPDAARLIRKRVNRAVRWGFQFIAVAPSAIPDEALHAMELTRAKANTLALHLARDAAGNVPVVVAGSGISTTNAADWRRAADAIKVMTNYGAAPAPMRLNTDALDPLTKEGIAALRDWTGPIEVVGTGKPGLRRALSREVLSGRGGPPLPVQPAGDTAEPDAIETDAANLAEENEATAVSQEGQPEKPPEEKGLFRGMKRLGRSIF